MPSPIEPAADPVDPKAPVDPPAAAPSPVSPPAPKAAPSAEVTRTTRLGAALVDAFAVILLGLPLVGALQARLDRLVDPARAPSVSAALVWGFGGALVALHLFQWLLAARGRSLGKLVAGLATVPAEEGGAAPGLWRAVVIRRWWRGALAAMLALAAGGVAPAEATLGTGNPFIASLAAFPLAWLLALVVDALPALGTSRRTLGDRLARTRTVGRAGGDHRAYVPPYFAASGLAVACVGIVLSLSAAMLAGAGVDRIGLFESTEMDVPVIVATVTAILGLCATGALAAYTARRFLVGELALTALALALLAFELMALRLVPVPALQRFDVPGWLDWSVYALGLYFGTALFLVIGSALGFMVAGDDGLDLSTRFERLVARRHLRLKLSHYALLALIATLVPMLVYGVVIWPLRAAWRLVRGQPAPRPLPPTVFMALLTVVGVMFGVMSLTVVLSVMGGFERDLKEKILGTNAHGVVHRYVGEFSEWREVERKVKAVPGVEGVTPFILSEVMITTDGAVSGAVLKGIDVETVGQVTDLEKNVEAGRIRDLLYADRIPRTPSLPPPGFDDLDGLPQKERPAGEADEAVLPGIVIGREMARGLRVWIGDKVTVMNPLGELGPQGPIPRSRTFRVAAIFFSGMYEYDSKFAYIQLREAQRFFRLGEAITGLELRFRNVDEARPMMRRILGVLEGFPYRTKDWGEMNKNLFSALRLERVVMFILLSFQVLIACICVIATLVMLVVEKRKEVATLKAMGAREGSIMKLFVLEGLLIGAIGTVYGVAAGLLFCQVVDGVKLDPEVYYITHLPVVVEPLAVALVAIVAMVLVFVATLYPARRGGSIAPVEGFREE